VQRAAERTKVAAEESAKMGLHAVQRGVEKAGSAVKDRLHRSNETPEGLVGRQGI
jgi:hypothetical protein